MEAENEILSRMVNFCRDMDKDFAMCQERVKRKLEEMAMVALHSVRRPENKEGIASSESRADEERKIMEEKFSEMGKLQTDVREMLQPLTKFLEIPDLGFQDGSKEGPQGTQGRKDRESPEETEKQDKALERVLEDAAVKKMEKEYESLPVHLKMCLLCFSIFPVDKVIEKKVLIYWWIGEGFATATQEDSAEKVAENHFEKLKQLGFILPVYNRRRGNFLRCRLHPWIRWFIIKVSREECFFYLDEKGMPSLHPSESQRACLVTGNKDGLLEEPYRPAEKPTPLAVFNVNVKCVKLDKDSLSNFKNLVVLQLGRWEGSTDRKKNDYFDYHIGIDEPEILDKLDGFLNLRYLSLRGTSMITKLPKWIGACRRLQILDLRGCQNLDQLTEDIKSLERLTHLDVSESYMLEYMPKALTHLSELEVLKGFVCSTSSRRACKIADLTNLNKLRKLSIRIDYLLVEKSTDLYNLNLKEIKSLETLSITWSSTLFDDIKLPVNRVKPDLLLALPDNLGKLDLRCFPGKQLSRWLQPRNLPKLEKLYIRGGRLESLHVEEYGHIKKLRLKYLKSLKLNENDINELRETLDYLEIYECPKIEPSYPFDLDSVWVNDDPHPDGAAASPSAPTSTAPSSGPVSTTATSEPVLASAPASAVPAAASSPPTDESSSPVPGPTTDSTSAKDASVTAGATPVLASTAATSSDPSPADHASTQAPSTVATPAPAAAPSPASASIVAPRSTSGSVPTTPAPATEAPSASSIPPPPSTNPSQ